MESSAGNALTVSELTGRIDRAIRTNLPSAVTVRGEVSRPKYHPASGHLYFTLKDAGACIDAVMWKSDLARVKFRVDNGLELLASGSVKVFATQGKYQLYVNRLQPVGAGALELALKQMRAKLEAEGLFAAERKRAIPLYPRRIVIVTSRSTAALQDVIKVFRRVPFLQLFIYHVPVQGEGAGQQIAAALGHLSACHEKYGAVDLVILTRGGGSLEDLWQFNEECVARAIVASRLPIITGIGHEIDTSIADLVADHHAHTPTEAASVAIVQWIRAADAVRHSAERIRSVIDNRLSDARHRLNAVSRNEFFRRPTARIDAYRQRLVDEQRALDAIVQGRLRLATIRLERAATRLTAGHPRHRIALQSLRLGELERRLNGAMTNSCRRHTLSLDSIGDRLRAMSPTEVLRRGYSITTRKRDGEILRSATGLRGGERIVTKLAEGEFESVAVDPKQGSLF